jgi:adenylosuccinate lyase
MARLLRGNLTVAMENNVLWHERDISHSSAERVILPDSFHAAAFMLKDIIKVVDGLNVYPENIKKNLDITREVYYSQKVLTLLVEKGVARQQAYEIIQKNAMDSWLNKKGFRQLILADQEVNKRCTREELEKAFSEKELLAGIDKIFHRFEGERNKP